MFDFLQEDEEKKQQKNFETKKKKEVDRITAWQVGKLFTTMHAQYITAID